MTGVLMEIANQYNKLTYILWEIIFKNDGVVSMYVIFIEG